MCGYSVEVNLLVATNSDLAVGSQCSLLVGAVRHKFFMAVTLLSSAMHLLISDVTALF